MRERIQTNQETVPNALEHYASTGQLPNGNRFPNIYSDPESLTRTFSGVLPDGVRIQDHIKERLAHKSGAAIGVEFGGVGSQFFASFGDFFLQHGYGITLYDERDPQQRLADRSIQSRHTIISGPHKGNIFSNESTMALNEALDSSKADFIIERMDGGLTLVDQNLKPGAIAWLHLFQEWYSLLSEDGIMLIQIPLSMDSLIKPWTKKIESEAGTTLEVRSSNTLPGAEINHSTLSIQKKSGSPVNLPILTESEIVNKSI